MAIANKKSTPKDSSTYGSSGGFDYSTMDGKFNQPPYKHSQPPVQGKRVGMPNPNADTEQYEQLMEKYKSPKWEARKAAEGTITEQPGNLITYAYLPKQLIPSHPVIHIPKLLPKPEPEPTHPVYIIGSNPIWCYR